MNEPNSFGNPEFLKDLKFIDDQLSKPDPGRDEGASQTRAGEEFRLDQELEQACLATGATGAAIALVRADKIVCHATAGPDAPDIGVYLDPSSGLSGSCIQTRQLQQCSDTETDPRVDPAASRRLGVRSIVVLPLIEGDKLFGIFEVLSPRPNAFSPRDLDILQTLTNRIVSSRSKNWEAATTAPAKEPDSFAHKVGEVVDQGESRNAKLNPKLDPFRLDPATSASASLGRKRTSRKTDITVSVLGILVIASALLLGTLVGWRMGWQRATLALRASSPGYRTAASFKTDQIVRSAFPANPVAPSIAKTDECGLSPAATPQTQPLSGGLTVCEEGRVIFRLPASPPSPTAASGSAQHSSALAADPKRK